METLSAQHCGNWVVASRHRGSEYAQSCQSSTNWDGRTDFEQPTNKNCILASPRQAEDNVLMKVGEIRGQGVGSMPTGAPLDTPWVRPLCPLGTSPGYAPGYVPWVCPWVYPLGMPLGMSPGTPWVHPMGNPLGMSPGYAPWVHPWVHPLGTTLEP